ncbi:hypothetical protein [Candidatus Avelusimicrobium faecicola]|uniref:hypothetical protein n=1 Tax=Candidatus Avelusimicrobium faecicola TaxID=3416205 RepID=UPI002A63F2B3|nr:hypothetical protein [Spirochaetota bacterium]MDE3277855.1 hypothetical protein [Spirochaetota bacterium]MDY2939780.1 hypothetical protein [Elusimicrobiaceae bacterium]MDY6129101.1 hypothetical protein [Elusimicrobiaceae bacterium]
MQEKLKQLELLVSQVAARQQQTQAQNTALHQKVRQLEENLDKLRTVETEVKTLREWKRTTQQTLKRLLVKVDKEIQKSRQDENAPL